MRSISVTEALSEIKVLKSRIDRIIEGGSFVEAAKTSESKVNPSLSKEDFEKNAKASMQSVVDLMDRMDKIKTAVIESNACTRVEICGEKCTVAKAIYMKSAIEQKKALLRTLEEELVYATQKMQDKNAIMEQKINDFVAIAFGREAKQTIKESDYETIAKPFREGNEYSLVDPIDIKQTIEHLKDYIEEFESTVDSKLQISNCITHISVE